MPVIDTSAWIEWLSDTELGRRLSEHFENWATALSREAQVVTCDAHFERLAAVIYHPKVAR